MQQKPHARFGRRRLASKNYFDVSLGSSLPHSLSRRLVLLTGLVRLSFDFFVRSRSENISHFILLRLGSRVVPSL